MNLDHLIRTEQTALTQRIEQQDFRRSDIDNREMNELSFNDCRFDRSSITCIRARNSTFTSCQFLNADILSCSFTDCTFENCDFSLANLGDNTFNRCNFRNTVFTGATIRANEYLSVVFVQISLRGSVTSLNTFRNTVIEDSEFGNCTVDYNILEECSLQNSIINAESFGSFFGLEPTMLDNVSFVSLGHPVEEDSLEHLLDLTRKEFEEERRYTELFVLNQNLSAYSTLDSTIQLCEKLKEKVLAGNYIPADQLTFIFNVFKELYRRKRLGFLVLDKLRTSVGDILNVVSTEYKFYENFVLLYNNLGLLYQSLLSDLATLEDWEYLSVDRPIFVKLHFETKPTTSIPMLLETCYQYVYDTPLVPPPVILDERKGSYLVFLETLVKTIIALNLSCFLLVGTVKHLIKLRANLSVLTSKKLPRKYYLAVTKPDTEISIPQAVATLVAGLIKKVVPGELQDSLQAIGADNLKEIIEVTESLSESDT